MATALQVVIRPRRKITWRDIQEIWKYRELLYFFAWRDLKVRYKQTIIGIGWVVFQPLITMVVFTVFFGTFAKMPSDNIPYPIFVYAGLLFWQLFSGALSETSNSLIANQPIITKVYFPRLILPLSSVLTKCVDFSISTVILIVLMLVYGYLPGFSALVLFPLLLFITLLASLGIGLLFAAINVKYRDVRYVIPFFVQLLLFITPVIYPSSITGSFERVLEINPMTGVIESARTVLFHTAPLDGFSIFSSFLIALFFFCIGAFSFKMMERYFADLL